MNTHLLVLPAESHVHFRFQSPCFNLAIVDNNMELFVWYSVAILSAFSLILLKKIYHTILSLSQWTSGHLKNKVIFNRGRWSAFTMTPLDITVLAVFFGGNALLTAWNLRSGLATIVVINLVPLFLAGRTNLLMDYLSIPLHVHQLGHHSLGLLVVIQATIHGVVSLSQLSGPNRSIAIGTFVLLT